jgi:hypothetical protein
MDSFDQRIPIEADGASALHFSRAEHEAVVKREARADAMLVQKTRELMAQSGETDFVKAFERVAQLNPTMYEFYRAPYRYGGRHAA